MLLVLRAGFKQQGGPPFVTFVQQGHTRRNLVGQRVRYVSQDNIRLVLLLPLVLSAPRGRIPLDQEQ